MAMEVACGQCQGRLLVEQTGVVVACPHCGAHLAIPGETAAANPTPTPAPEPPAASLPTPAPQLSASPQLLESQFTSPSQWPSAAADVPFPNFGIPSEPAHRPKLADHAPSTPAVAAAGHSGSLFADDFAKTHTPDPSDPPVQDHPDRFAATVQFNGPAPTDGFFNELTQGDGTPRAEEPAFFFPAEAAGESPDGIFDFGGAPAAQGGVSTLEPPRIEQPNWSPPRSSTHLEPSIPVSAPVVANLGIATAVEPPAPAANAPFSSAPFSMPTVAPAASVGMATKAENDEPLLDATYSAPRPKGVPPLYFMMLASYASAMTIAFIYMWLARSTGPNPLDLPDLKPPKTSKGEIGFMFIDEKATLPPRYVLGLKEEARFGNVTVRPLRVTRGPLEFVHYKNPALKKAPSDPVLKLWVEFENVSTDQTFAPIDKDLMFSTLVNKKNSLPRANNFVCRIRDRKVAEKRVLMYEISPTSEYDIRGQNVESNLHPRELSPGESLTTFIPTSDAQIDQLSGDLTWRVYFRKGYNPGSMRGVTTIVEIQFNSDEIEDDAPGQSA